MRKNFILFPIFFVLMLGFISSFAQSLSVNKGQSMIDVNVGFPNFYPVIIKQSYNNNYDLTRGVKPDYSVSNFLPISIKYEYLLNQNTGFGVNIYYANSVIEWEDVSYSYTSKVERLRVALTYNYHFATTKKFDPYFNAHIGYSNVNYTFDQVSNIVGVPVVHPKPDIKFDYPITLRAALGFRYYLTEKIALNAEAGLGGILISGGLSFKL